MEQEKWFSIPGFEGHYEFSSNQRVRSLKNKKVKILKQSKRTHGYLQVGLAMPGKKTKSIGIHRLSWMVHTGNEIPKDMEIDHIDENKLNNDPSNLRLISHTENIRAYHNNHKNDKKIKKQNTSCKKIPRKIPRNIARHLSRGNVYFVVKIQIEGKQVYIGNYKEEEMARCVAEFARAGIFPSRVRAKIEAEKNKINNA